MVIDTLLDCEPMFLSMQTTDQDSFWEGDDVICWSHGYDGFQHFPTLTISLAASANESIRLIVSPRQYLRLAGSIEHYNDLLGNESQYDCFRVSISSSESGLCFCFVTVCFVQLMNYGVFSVL